MGEFGDVGLAVECPNLAWRLSPRGRGASLGACSQFLSCVYSHLTGQEELNLSHQDGPGILDLSPRRGETGAIPYDGHWSTSAGHFSGASPGKGLSFWGWVPPLGGTGAVGGDRGGGRA